MLKKIYHSPVLAFCCFLLLALCIATPAQAGPEEFNGKWNMDLEMLLQTDPELAKSLEQPELKAVFEGPVKNSFLRVDTSKKTIEYTVPGEKTEIDQFEIMEHSKGKMLIKTQSDQVSLELVLSSPTQLKMSSPTQPKPLYFKK